MKVKDRLQCDSGMGRYSLPEALLEGHMEVVANAKYVEAQGPLEMWLGWIAAKLSLESLETESLRLPKGWYMTVTGERDTRTLVCPGSDLYGHYSAKDKLTMAKNLEMEEVLIGNKSRFVVLATSSMQRRDAEGFMNVESKFTKYLKELILRIRLHLYMLILWGELQRNKTASNRIT